MIDFAEARRNMVEGQIRTFDVSDTRILAAMLAIPREQFVPPAKRPLAYADCDLVLGRDHRNGEPRCLLKPMVLAKLIQAAEVDEQSRVLDVGCLSGYASAVLARFAGSVVALEQDPEFAAMARQVIAALGIGKVEVFEGALTQGVPGRAPYDVILLDGASEIPPKSLFAQLKDGGCLVGVLGRPPIGKAMLYRAEAGHVSGVPIFDAVAPVLPGFAKPLEFVF